MSQSNNMLPPARTTTGARTSNPAGATAATRSRTTTTVSRPTVSSRTSNHRAGTTVRSPIPPTGVSFARMDRAEQAAILQAAEEQYISELYAADEEYMNADEGYMDDDEELYDDDEERMTESRWVDVYAPLTQAAASLAAAAKAKANQQLSLALPPLRGIHLIAFDIRQAQASIDLARVAGNASLVQVEQSLLAAFQIELSATLARVQQ